MPDYLFNLLMSYLDALWISDGMVQEQITCFLKIPIFRYFKFFLAFDILQDGFDAAVFDDQTKAIFWSNSINLFTIVASEQDAQVNELWI